LNALLREGLTGRRALVAKLSLNVAAFSVAFYNFPETEQESEIMANQADHPKHPLALWWWSVSIARCI
jgi:hypothetical protein